MQAAYSLVRDVGFEGLTAEAVADRAGVSRRTFFNYFPSVESVLTASVTEFFASVGARLEARPLDEDVLDSALAVVTDPGDTDLLERIGVLAAAGEASPHARGLILVALHAWVDWLEGWLRRRLGADATDVYVATLASGLVGASEAAFRVWLRQTATASGAGVTASDVVERTTSLRDCFSRRDRPRPHRPRPPARQRRRANRLSSLPTSRRPPCPRSCTASAAGAPPTPGAR